MIRRGTITGRSIFKDNEIGLYVEFDGGNGGCMLRGDEMEKTDPDDVTLGETRVEVDVAFFESSGSYVKLIRKL